MMHDLKTWPEPFEAIWSGAKRYEIRRADRPFKVGDLLRLYEWSPGTEATGREVDAFIKHITPAGEWGLPHDVCVMGIEVVSRGRYW